jgi:hypothetical protein
MVHAIGRAFHAAAVVCALASQTGQPGGAGRMTIDLSQIGQSGQSITFTEAKQVKQLPQSVMDQFPSGIVDPKEDFQVTDVVVGKLRPTRRLVVAGISEKYCLLYYERGGIAHVWLIALFVLSKNKAKLAWVSMAPARGILGLSDLKTTVESGDLKDQPGHNYW